MVAFSYRLNSLDSCSGKDSDPSPFHPQLARGKQPDGLRVSKTLFLKHARRQRFRRVVLVYRDSSLQDNWPVVVLVIRKMDRATADLGSVGQDCLVDVVAVISLAAKGGNK